MLWPNPAAVREPYTPALTPDIAGIADALALLLGEGSVTELRVLHTRRGTVSGYFTDRERLARAASAWSGKAPGVYLVLNPVTPLLLARADNRTIPYARHTTADDDVLNRCWLPIDFDPLRPAGISATDAEHAAAITRARACRDWLITLGFPPAALVLADSGNGAHVLVRIDLPNDVASHALIRGCLQALDLRWSDAHVGVDQTTHNAARIWKLYGTLAAKGDSTADRPHRLAQILEGPAPDALVVAPRAALDQLAAMALPTPPARSTPGAASGPALDVERWLAEHGLGVQSTGPWQGGQKWVLAACPWNAAHQDRAACVVQFPTGAVAARCHHNSCAGRGWADLKGLFSSEPGATAAAAAAPRPSPITWPAPGPLPPLTPPAPTLPDALVPGPLRPWVCDTAARLAVPLEYIAVPAVVGLGAVVGRTVGILPKRRDDWVVVPNLWGGLIGRPGVLKTACVQEGMRPVRRLAAEAARTFTARAAADAATRAVLELQLAALKERGRSAAKKGASLADLTAEVTAVQEQVREASPVERRYLTQDATVEKLGELLLQNPHGLLVLRDELTGFLRTLDKPGREGDREFYLEAWNGNGEFTYDRIGRGTLHIPAVTISLLGSIQPGKLTAYVEGALTGGAGDDGLLQRLQLLVWPDEIGAWTNVDRWPDRAARAAAADIYAVLDGFDPLAVGVEAVDDHIPALRFAPAAQDLFDAWRAELEQRLRGADLLATPAFESHLAKYRSLMPSLALLFHLVTIVPAGEGGPVSLAAARLAAEWCDFLELHAWKVYAVELHGDAQAAHHLAAKLRAGQVQDGMPLREIHRAEWSGLRTPDRVDAAIASLQAIGWCVVEPLETGGRPSAVLRLNPALEQPR